METQSLDFPISSSSDAAIANCRQAMRSYTRRRSDVVSALQHAIEEDPRCAFAHALLGLMMHGARHVSLKEKVENCRDQAVALQDDCGCNELERGYIAALQQAALGDLDGMIEQLKTVSRKNPTDIFAIALAQGELFWLGRLQESLQLSNELKPYWTDDAPGYAEYLGCRAFDLEEAGFYTQAEHCGRESVERDPASIWATHAVSHVLYMQGRYQEGVGWIEPQQSHWDDCNQIKFHVWWHKCLFQLDMGHHAEILHNYDLQVRNRQHELMQAMPDLYIDMQNGSSMLWRLEQQGVDVGDRWQDMAELARARLDDFTSPFTSAHFAVILAAVGDFEACKTLVANMEQFAAGDEAGHRTLCEPFRLAAIPAAKAAIAHRRGKFAEAQALLSAARHHLWQMGGSHAQQDLFFQILFDATIKTSNAEFAKTLLQEIEHLGFFRPETRLGYAAALN